MILNFIILCIFFSNTILSRLSLLCLSRSLDLTLIIILRSTFIYRCSSSSYLIFNAFSSLLYNVELEDIRLISAMAVSFVVVANASNPSPYAQAQSHLGWCEVARPLFMELRSSWQ